MTSGALVAPADDAVAQLLDEGLERVEAELREATRHTDAFIDGASTHLVAAGGKRLRPLLTLLAGQLGPRGGADGAVPASDDVVKAAVVVELTHLASLYHDDVMDEAVLRRGVDSANTRYGNTIAILTGDLLFSRASQVVADLGTDAVRIQAQTFERLCAGQIAETVGPSDGRDEVEHYLQVLADKTGSLIATAGLFGARFGGADDATVDVLRQYGERLGVAFQLADDLLDLSSQASDLGKTPGTDLREGVPTLPVLYALAGDDTDPSAVRLREILATGPITDDDLHAEALTLLRESAAMKRARETVRTYAEEARAQLAPLPEGDPKRAMEGLCDFIADRTS